MLFTFVHLPVLKVEILHTFRQGQVHFLV